MYGRLWRNLSELESKLKYILSGQEDDPEACRQRFIELADEIERRVDFLKKHIAAELASHPPDHQLSTASRSFDALHSVINRLKNNLLPIDDYMDDDDDESCCLHEEDEVLLPGSDFTLCDNPLAFDDDHADTELVPYAEGDDEERTEKCVGGNGCSYWRPMLLGVLLGGVTVAVAAASLVVGYGGLCSDFISPSYYSTITVFPPPT